MEDKFKLKKTKEVKILKYKLDEELKISKYRDLSATD